MPPSVRRAAGILLVVAVCVIVPALPAAAAQDSFFWTGGNLSSMSSSDASNWSGTPGFGDGDGEDTVYVQSGIEMDIDSGPVTLSRLMVEPADAFSINGTDSITILDQLALTGYGLSIANPLVFSGAQPNGTTVFVSNPEAALIATGPVTIPQAATVITYGLVGFAGPVSGGTLTVSGSGSVSLTGGGSLTALNVQEGSVSTNSALTAPATVSPGATLSGGSATNTGDQQTVSAVSLATGAVLSPGAALGGADEGLFAVTGDLHAAPGSTLRLGAGAAHDTVAVGGVASIDGARLDLTVRPGLPTGTRMTVLSAQRVDGRLAATDGTRLEDGAEFVADGQRWRIHYDAGAVTVEAVARPELAATGGRDAAPWLAVGLALLVVGGALVRRSRVRG